MNFWVESKHVRAVLFDLDDTLFYHKFSRLKGLVALQEEFPRLKSVPLATLEKEHEKLLRADYDRVLENKVSVADGTTERIKNLCNLHGVNLDLTETRRAVEIYTKAYMRSRRAVPGSRELLSTLKKNATLGVVTNGLVEPQVEKMRTCQIAEPLDFIVISAAVDCKKPSREIFELALKRTGYKPWETVYVGDSWDTDILPAVNAGMKAVWLNRYGLDCPDSSVAREIDSFEGVNSDVFLKW